MSYDSCKPTKLKLKGVDGGGGGGGSVQKKKKKRTGKSRPSRPRHDPDSDSEEYALWWRMGDMEQMGAATNIAVEHRGTRRFWHALDNGRIVLGPSRALGEGPAAEEQFTIIKTADSTKFALKTGFMKYITVGKENFLQGISDAIGSRECFEAVFEENKAALCCGNNCFATLPKEDDSESPEASASPSETRIAASALAVGEREVLSLRTDLDRFKRPEPTEQDVDFGRLDVAELSYVKKFQSFQDKRVRVNPEDREKLQRAREEGKLHEALLDRRSKMKHDKFC